MRIEIPEVKRCCCCLPLRRGMLVWIYLKMIIGLLVLFIIANNLIIIVSRSYQSLFSTIILSISLIVFLVDIAFCILFIISAHRKKPEHMRIYYRYSIVMLILGVIALLAFVGMEIFIFYASMPYSLFILHYMMEFTCSIFVHLVLHAYFIILVRSEVVKLEKNAKFEFINHTTEPECKAQIIA